MTSRSFKIDYRVAYSRATFDRAQLWHARSTAPRASTSITTTSASPNYPTIKITDGTNATIRRCIRSSKFSNATEKDADQEWSYAGNVDGACRFIERSGPGEGRLRSAAPHQKSGHVYTKLMTTPSGGKVSKLSTSPPYRRWHPIRPITEPLHERPGINEALCLGSSRTARSRRALSQRTNRLLRCRRKHLCRLCHVHR